MVRKLLSMALVFQLAIPPQVWADVAQSPEPEAQNKTLEGTPLYQPETERDRLRFEFHKVSRFTDAVIRTFAPGLIPLRGTEYHMALGAYGHCKVEKAQVGGTTRAAVQTLDGLLSGLQKKVADWFEAKGSSFENLMDIESEEGLDHPSVDVLSARDGGCVPTVWDPAQSDPNLIMGAAANQSNLQNAVKLRQRLDQVESQGLEFLQPFFLEWSRKRKDALPLTNAEARQVLGWLTALRDFRNILADQFGYTEPLPDLILPPGPAQRVASNDKRVMQNRAGVLLTAEKMMSATQLSEQLPRFVPCATKKRDCGVDAVGDFAAKALCYCDGARDSNTRIEEKIYHATHQLTDRGKPSAATHGVHLNAERLLAIQALMMEMATVATLLPRAARPANLALLLPASCRASEDLSEQVKIFENYSSVQFREWWLQRLQKAAEQNAEKYRLGSLVVPVPATPKLYARANQIVKAWIAAVFAQSKENAEPLGEPTTEQSVTEMAEAFTFEERILDGQERLAGGANLREDFARLLLTWGTLIPWEFEKLPEGDFTKNRNALVGEMVRQAYESALLTAFQGYAGALFSGDPLVFTRAMILWEKQFRSQWQDLLSSRSADEPVGQELDRIGKELTQELFTAPAFQEEFNPEKLADQTLRKYVRLVGPRAREAFIANQVEEFMESHHQDQENVHTNLLPGGFWNPHNYYHRAAQVKDTTAVPAAFQTAAGGRNQDWYEVFISTIHPGERGDYVSLRKTYEVLAASKRKLITQRITRVLLKMRSTIDDELAKWILNQFPKEAAALDVGGGKARAGKLLSTLEDDKMTEACEKRASEIASLYFKGGANVGSIADIVLEKLNETFLAKDRGDRGRQRAARARSYEGIQKWLADPTHRQDYLDKRIDLAARLYDFQLRVPLELRTKDNAQAVDKTLQERLGALSNQKILVPGLKVKKAAASLVALQENHDRSLKAGEESSRVGEFVKTFVKEGLIHRWAEVWAKDPEAWFRQGAGIYDSPHLESYFNARVRTVTGQQLKGFLNIYGSGRSLYTGEQEKAHAATLAHIQTRLMEAWVGHLPTVGADGKPYTPAEWEALQPVAKDLLIGLSKAAHAEGGNAAAFEMLPDRVASISNKYSLYAKWLERVGKQRDEIQAAIASKDPEQVKKAASAALRILYYEGNELFIGVIDLTPENLRKAFIQQVAHGILPSFTTLRDVLTGEIRALLKGEAEPMETLSMAEERRMELKDTLWDFEEKGKKNPDPYKRAEREIEHLEKDVIPKAQAQIHREMIFSQLVETYLPATLSAAAKGGSGSNLWLAFIRRQFLESLTDARGEDMNLSMSVMVEDLNTIARKTQSPLEIDAEIASSFVEQMKDYFSAWLRDDANRASLDRHFSKTLEVDRAQLAGLEKNDPELWWGFLHVAQNAPDSPGMRDFLNKTKQTNARLQSALRLHRAWYVSKGTTEGFGNWLKNAGKFKDPEPMGGFPPGTRFAQTLVARAGELEGRLKALASGKTEKSGETRPVLLSGVLRQDYERFARAVSDLVYHPVAQLGPVAESPAKIFWPSVPPTTDLNVSHEVRKGVFAVTSEGLDERFVTETILKILLLPKVNEAVLSQLVSPFVLIPLGIQIPEFKDDAEKIHWVNSLSTFARYKIYDSLKMQIQSNLVLAATVHPLLLAAFDGQGDAPLPRLDQEAWYQRMGELLGVWRKLHASFSQVTPPPAPVPQPPIAGMDGVAVRIVRMYLDHTQYRLKAGGRWVVAGSEPALDNAESVALFKKYLTTDRRRAFQLVEDVGRTFAKHERLALDGLFVAGGTPSEATPIERAVDLFIERFNDESLRQKDLGSVYVDAWRRFYNQHTLEGRNPLERPYVGFAPAWVLGAPTDQKTQFVEWVERLEGNPGSRRAFLELRRQPAGLNPHIWQRYKSLSDVFKSKNYQQIVGLMEVADANSHYKAQEQTYPFFVVLTDWNKHEHSSALNPGQALALPFDDTVRTRFMGECLDALGFDPKAFSGWEVPLKKWGADPALFAALARNKKILLVGVGDNRFLSTGTPTDWVGKDWRGRPNKTLNAVPVVSDSERRFLRMETTADGSVADFSKYVSRLHSPEIESITRMNADRQITRPLYQNLLSLETRMFGEADVQNARLRAATLTDPEATKSGKRHTRIEAVLAGEPFGRKLVMDEEKAKMVQHRLKLQGLFPLPSVKEIQNASKMRNAYVDFTHALDELGEADTARAVAVLERFVRQLYPKYPDAKIHEVSGLVRLAGGVGSARQRAKVVGAEYVHERVYGGQSENEIERLSYVLTQMDRVYVEEMQTFDVRDAFGRVIRNNQDYLTKLCDPKEVKKLQEAKTEADLEAMEGYLKESGLAFSTGIHKYYYLDSGLVEDGANNETRRRVDAITRKLSRYRRTLNGVGNTVNMAVGLGLFAYLFAKPFPGVGALGRAATRNVMGRWGLMAVTSLIAGYFAWEISDDMFDIERMWAPDEMDLIRKVAETQFRGYRPLRRDKHVAVLDDKRITQRVEDGSGTRYFTYLWRVWVLGLTYSMVSPYVRALKGGIRYAWHTRFKFRWGVDTHYAQRELAREARKLGVDPELVLGADPIEANRILEQGQLRVSAERTAGRNGMKDWFKRAQAEMGRAVPGALEMAGEVFPSRRKGVFKWSPDAATAMRKGIDAEIEAVASQNHVHPITGQKLEIPRPTGFSVSNRLSSHHRDMLEAQDAAVERIAFLKQLRGKLSGPHAHFNSADLNRWLPLGADARVTNTPVWVNLAGVVPFYSNEAMRLVGALQRSAGRVQTGERMVALRWLLGHWRIHPTGLPVFREAARQIGCHTVDLMNATYLKNSLYRSVFTVQIDESLAGKIGTLEKQQAQREALINSARELLQALQLGGWGPNPRIFEMLAEPPSIKGDQKLVRQLLSQPRGTVVPVVDFERKTKSDVADDELGYEGTFGEQAVDPVTAPTKDDVLADSLEGMKDPFAVAEKKQHPFTARGAIIPETETTESGVLDYLEVRLSEHRTQLGVAQPLSAGDRDWILARMKRLNPESAHVVEEKGILQRRFSAEDLGGVTDQLRRRGLLSPVREDAYRMTMVYLEAYQRYGQTADFDEAVQIFAYFARYAGLDQPYKAAVKAFEILYGKKPMRAAGEFHLYIDKARSLVGDAKALDPLIQSVREERFAALEQLVQRMHAAHPQRRHSRALLRLASARKLLNGMAETQGVERTLDWAKLYNPKVHGPSNVALVARMNVAEGSKTPAVFRHGVYQLLEQGLRSDALNGAMVSLRGRKEFWTTELKECFRYALAYTSGLEAAMAHGVVAVDPARVRWASEIYLELFKLVDVDLSAARAMFVPFFQAQHVRHFGRFFQLFGFNDRVGVQAIGDRARLLSDTLMGLVRRPEFAVFTADTQRAVARIAATEEVLVFEAGPDFGFKAAWDAAVKPIPAGETAGVTDLLQRELSGKSSLEIIDTLADIRLRTILEVTAREKPVSALDALDRATLLVRSRLLLKLLYAENVVGGEELERVAKALMEFSKTGKVRFMLSQSEAEALLIGELHGIEMEVDRRALNYRSLENLKAVANHMSLPSPRHMARVMEAIDIVTEATRSGFSIDRYLLKWDDLGLTWEQLTQLLDSDAFHYVAVRGGGEEALRGAGILEGLLSKGAVESDLRDRVVQWLKDDELKQFNAWVNENARRARANVAPLPQETSYKDELIESLVKRRDWAKANDDVIQVGQMDRAISAIKEEIQEQIAPLGEQAADILEQAGDGPGAALDFR